jgi:hypothetical protein
VRQQPMALRDPLERLAQVHFLLQAEGVGQGE